MPKKTKASRRNRRGAKKNTNLVPKVKGKGFYSGFLSDAGGLLGSGLGAIFGESSVGKSIGSGLGNIVSKITGFGSYKVNSNTLMADTGPPVFANGAEGSVIVARREFIGDVKGSIAFRNNTFTLNPGNPAMFPWLSRMATAFEQYQIMGMILEYKPTSGSAISSTNNSLGTVIMSTNYDILDSAFASKQAMENYQYTTSTVPSGAAIHCIECKPKLNVLENMYVRQLSYSSSADPRFYDLGNFQLATVGMQADDIVVGELWVSYHVKLLKPKIPDSNIIGFNAYGTGSLTLAASRPDPNNANTVPQDGFFSSVPYTSTSGSILVTLKTPGIYYYRALTLQTTAATENWTITYNSTANVNISRVSNFPDNNGYVNTTAYKVSGGTSATTFIDNSVGTQTGVNSCVNIGAFYVGRGGGIVNFTNSGSPSNITGTSLTLEYMGFFDRSIDPSSPPTSDYSNEQMSALLSRITSLEKNIISSKDDEEKEPEVRRYRTDVSDDDRDIVVIRKR